MDANVNYDCWNNDLTLARKAYTKNPNAEIIKIDFDTPEFTATKRMCVAEAEELIRELSDHIRWIKEA